MRKDGERCGRMKRDEEEKGREGKKKGKRRKIEGK